MSFKLQVRCKAFNSSAKYEWLFMKPFNSPDYEYDTRVKAERALHVITNGTYHERYRIKEV